MLDFAFEVFATADEFNAEGSCDCDATWTDDDIDAALETASDVVAQLSGVRGRRTMILRPVNPNVSCGDIEYGWPSSTPPSDGLPPHFTVPGTNPTIGEVKVDGVVLASGADYVVLDGNKLVRLKNEPGAADHGEPIWWPVAQKVWHADTAVDTFSVSVTAGVGSGNILMRNATVAVACAILRVLTIRRNAAPAGTTSFSVRGQTTQVKEAAEAIAEGHANIPAVVQLLAWVGSAGSHSWAYSPDQHDGWTFHVLSA